MHYLQQTYAASLSLILQTVGLARSTFHYREKRNDQEVAAKLLELAEGLPNRGFEVYYRRIRQQNLVWNRKRVLRVYRSLGLVRRRKIKQRLSDRPVQKLEEPPELDHTYSMDFMADALEDGRRLRVLNIMDDYNREALVCLGAVSFPAQRVIRHLAELVEERGRHPRRIRVDNGPEFLACALQQYCSEHSIELVYIQPGKPTQNAYIERFNRHFREDVLDAYLFESYRQFNVVAERFRQDFNYYHPHAGNGGLPPREFGQRRMAQTG